MQFVSLLSGKVRWSGSPADVKVTKQKTFVWCWTVPHRVQILVSTSLNIIHRGCMHVSPIPIGRSLHYTKNTIIYLDRLWSHIYSSHDYQQLVHILISFVSLVNSKWWCKTHSRVASWPRENVHRHRQEHRHHSLSLKRLNRVSDWKRIFSRWNFSHQGRLQGLQT